MTGVLSKKSFVSSIKNFDMQSNFSSFMVTFFELNKETGYELTKESFFSPFLSLREKEHSTFEVNNYLAVNFEVSRWFTMFSFMFFPPLFSRHFFKQDSALEQSPGDLIVTILIDFEAQRRSDYHNSFVPAQSMR